MSFSLFSGLSQLELPFSGNNWIIPARCSVSPSKPSEATTADGLCHRRDRRLHALLESAQTANSVDVIVAKECCFRGCFEDCQVLGASGLRSVGEGTASKMIAEQNEKDHGYPGNRSLSIGQRSSNCTNSKHPDTDPERQFT